MTLKLRDSEFKTITRSHTLRQHTRDNQLLFKEAQELLHNSYQYTPTRLIGITFEKLTNSYWQPVLF